MGVERTGRAARSVWAAYNDAQAGRAPRPLAVRVLELAGPGRGRRAVDLGCGSGVETRAMVAAGWRVTAVDADPTMPGHLRDLVRGGLVKTVVEDLRTVRLPSAALVHSSYALPFVPPGDFPAVWRRVRGCLLPGGWLAVTLFGDRDSWRGSQPLSFHSRAEVVALVDGMEVHAVDEEEWDGTAFGGEPKHWHVLEVTARSAGGPC